MSRRQEILAQVTSVPSLPAVVVKLREYLDDPEVNFSSLARVIELDPGLTANVLQLANSAYFGWRGTISSVRDAISRLGTSRIFQMVLCMSVAPLVRRPVRGYGLTAEQLWDHSIASAICCEQVAFKLQLSCANQAFTTGLLHDLGKIVLGTFVEIDDEPIREIVELDQLAFDEAERMVLGIDHAEVGAHLLRAWNLPDDVVAAARWHHDPGHNDTSYQDLVDLAHCADGICLNIGWGAGPEAMQYRLNDDCADRLGLKVKTVEDVAAQVMIGLEELRGMFTTMSEGKTHGVQHTAR
jgi:putative nucleotidyltransferase with HDIG domain